jgi:hypothetical protein
METSSPRIFRATQKYLQPFDRLDMSVCHDLYPIAFEPCPLSLVSKDLREAGAGNLHSRFSSVFKNEKTEIKSSCEATH